MAHRSQCSSAGDNPLDPNYLPPHCREEYRIAIDALVEENVDGYYQFLQRANVVDFLSMQEIEYIQCTVQDPQERHHPEPYTPYMDTGRDGSSDTYWPVLSDLDAPGLDLGWPQLHRFIGPTEVTTLVNPAEADMPTIKEQARRLIKNAQELVAVVMDVFTDVDIFADILDAASRNVAVYIILDEQNAHHFINMVFNCRVNLNSIQFLRVRTVSGITYRCRSGKSFKGQMMDRFLLTDCRAVLSGNYSFMWSFEKIHRCLAHLFLGKLVSTFDEEFRILFAQSQPLIIESTIAPMEEFGLLPESQFACNRTPMYKEQGKYFGKDGSTHSEEWIKPPFDEHMDMDWKKMPITRHESIHRSLTNLDPLDQGPVDIFNKYSSQPLRTDPSYEQRPSRMPANIMENPVFKRHNYTEGNHIGRTYQFMQHQGMTNLQAQGRQLHRGQFPYPTGPEDSYYYDKFGGGAYHPADQYPGLPEMEPDDSFDPVLNYLSSTSNVEMDTESDILLPPAEAQFGSSHPKRLSVGQPYVCQTSPTPSNPADLKQFFVEPNVDRKDPVVRQGLRDWRINSYLNAFDNEGDDDLQPAQASDPFEVPPKLLHCTASGPDVSIPSFSNVREFKIPTAPRVSQLPSYTKSTVPESDDNVTESFYNVREHNIPTALRVSQLPSYTKPTVPESVECVTEAQDTKTVPTTRPDLSSTPELDKVEEVKQKETKDTPIRREESFRRKQNAKVQPGSRLRSSLIFSSQLEQHVSQDCPTAPGQQDEDTDKNQEDQLKRPYVSQVLAHRRAIGHFEWKSYVRSATFDNSTTQTSKTDDLDKKENRMNSLKDKKSKDASENDDENNLSKPTEAEESITLVVAGPNMSNVEVLKTEKPVHPLKSLLSKPPCVDMSDPDKRLMFFKELAANRKAEKAAAAAAQGKVENAPPNPIVKKEHHASMAVSLNLSDSSVKKPTMLCEITLPANVAHGVNNNITTATHGSVKLNADDLSYRTNEQEDHLKCESSTSIEREQRRVSTDSDKIKFKTSQAAVSTHDSAGSYSFSSKALEPPNLSQPIVIECIQVNLPTNIDAKLPAVHYVTDTANTKRQKFDSATNESHFFNPSLLALPPFSISTPSEDYVQPPVSHQLEHSTSPPTIPDESSSGFSQMGLESSSLHFFPFMMSSSQILSKSSTVQTLPSDSIPIPPQSISAHSPTPLEPESSNSIPTDNCNTSLPTTLYPKPNKETQEALSPPPSSESVNQTPQESTAIMHTVLLCDPSQLKPDSLTEPTRFEAPSTLNSVHAQSNSLIDFEHNVSLTQFTTETYREESNPAELILESELHESLSKSISKTASVEPISDLLPTSLHTTSCLANVSSFETARHGEKELVTSSNLTSAEPTPENTEKDLSSKLDSIILSNCTVNSSANNSNNSLVIAHTLEMSLSEHDVLGYCAPSPAETAVSALEKVELTRLDGAEPVTSSDLTSVVPPPENTQKDSGSKLDSTDLSKESGSRLDSTDLSKCTVKTSPDDSDNSPMLAQTPEIYPTEPTLLDYSVLSHADTVVSALVNVDSSARPEGKEPVTTSDLTSVEPPPENTQKESSSKLDSTGPSKCTVKSSTYESDTSLTFAKRLEMFISEPTPLGSSASSTFETVVSPKLEKYETIISPTLNQPELCSSHKHSSTDTSNAPTGTSTELSSDNQIETTTKEDSCPTAPIELRSVTECQLSGPSEPVETGIVDNQSDNCKEPEKPDCASVKKNKEAETSNIVDKTPHEPACDGKASVEAEKHSSSKMPAIVPDEAIPLSPRAKQSKAGQFRYHSSTANVISSSNLRDDTKLLLEQISANSQSRSESIKEAAVTDDDKEDKVDKKVNKKKEGNDRSLAKAQAKALQEREKLLEKLQNMRKERKVYSRFEMAP